MAIGRKTFIAFLCDTPTLRPYIVNNNNVLLSSIHSGVPTWLPQLPQGWMDIALSFGRNDHYYGINRSFTIPLLFVNEGAQIIRKLYYEGRGIETLLNLLVLKWNDTSDVYELYYNGRLDFSKISDDVEVGVTINLMEGGAPRMLSAYEKTMQLIPCDGSIPENIKADDDGVILDDTLFYQFVPFTNSEANLFSPIPINFVSEQGDQVGLITAGQQYDPQSTDTFWYRRSGNYFLSSVDEINPTITGFITVEAEDPTKFANLQLKLLKNTQTTIADDAYQLLPATVTQGFLKRVSTQRTYHFSITLNLKANERLFFVFLNNVAAGGADQNLKIVGGSFTVQTATRFTPTAIWGMTLRDLFKLLIRATNTLSSQGAEVYDFQTISTLLDDNLNIFVTCGDAIRASGDTQYSKYYNLQNVDLASGTVINTQSSYGPAIKTCISDCFDAANVILNACLFPLDNNIHLEKKQVVFDSSAVTMSLGEVSNIKVTPADDYYFSEFECGYPEQSYDEKGGKYEPNTTARYASTIKSITQKFSLLCPYRTDSYAIEKLRSNSGGVSTTQNNSDSDVFLMDIDYNNFILDFFRAFFDADIEDPTQAFNGNQIIPPLSYDQNIPMFNAQGEYFLRQSDNSIFVFNQQNLATPYTVHFLVAGVINGGPGESVILRLYVGGAVVFVQEFFCTGVNTPININANVYTGEFLADMSFFITAETSELGEVAFNLFNVTVGDTILVANNAGIINIPADSGRYFIPLPDATSAQIGGKDIVTQDIDYYKFNSVLINPTFTSQFSVSAYIKGPETEFLKIRVYLNGVMTQEFQASGDNVDWVERIIFENITRAWALNDIIFFTASVDNTAVQISHMDFQATSTIKAYKLRRIVYDSITGIPHPESAYNIEFSPKRVAIKHFNWLKSVLAKLIPDSLIWKTLSKNRFLRTVLGLQVIDEDVDIPIASMGDQLFKPHIFEFDTEVPDTFFQLMNEAANAHVHFVYKGVDLFGFPVQMTQKPALNESQKWKLLCSPLVADSLLSELRQDGINQLGMFQSYCPHIVGAKFVPFRSNQDPTYNYVDMDSDWFINQYAGWVNRKNYFQKIQSGDTTPLQFRTNGLAPVTVTVKNKKGLTVDTKNFLSMPSPALKGNDKLYQITINWNDYPLNDVYFLIVKAGISPVSSTSISEGFSFRATHPKSLKLSYFHRRNKLSVIFDQGYIGEMRVDGTIDDYNPESDFVVYTDEPEDQEVINGRPYRSFLFNIGRSDGVPDWVVDKLNAIMLLSNVTIDGIQYSRETGAKFEKTKFPGNPKKYWTIRIRPAKNLEGTTFDLDNGLDPDEVNKNVSIVYNIDGNAFGNNSGVSNVIEVEFIEP